MSEELLSEEITLRAALDLSVSSRRHLVERILESIGEADHAEVERGWIVEVRKRLADFRQGTENTVPADKVFENIRTQ